VGLDGIDATKEGTDWTADEVALLVGSYFLMLAEERAGRDYNKSEYRRSVIAAIGRKPGCRRQARGVVGHGHRRIPLHLSVCRHCQALKTAKPPASRQEGAGVTGRRPAQRPSRCICK
jgi:hypothetical protein